MLERNRGLVSGKEGTRRRRNQEGNRRDKKGRCRVRKVVMRKLEKSSEKEIDRDTMCNDEEADDKEDNKGIY